jgi:hypothetical protein
MTLTIGLSFGVMYVCMYVCIYVCVYVCMYVCVYVCTYEGCPESKVHYLKADRDFFCLLWQTFVDLDPLPVRSFDNGKSGFISV